MRSTGFRFDKSQATKNFRKLLASVNAKTFEPELKDFARRALKEAAKETPVRDLATIKANQERQYFYRTHYAPSVHDPVLIEREDGVDFIKHNGKWYCSRSTLPDEVISEYFALKSELDRRKQLKETEFIRERSQARWLYKKVWHEVAASIDQDIGAGTSIVKAHSRRKPEQVPPKGYAQIRGGKKVTSIAIYTPLYSIPSRYIEFDPVAILNTAMARHRTNFRNAIARKARATIKLIKNG